MERSIAPQDQKDFQKFLKFLSIKAVQVIVQSRLGEKVHTRSKPHAMGQDWFNLAINDMQEITEETKKAMGGKLPSFELPLCIEISLKTSEGDSMVLENWCLGMNNRQDAHAKITYTVYNRMGMLLKSLLSVTRVTPAYRLARKQGLDYVICYRVYFGDVRVSELGEGFQTIRVGSVGTPVGSVTLSAAYRTNLTMANREPAMPVKSDHYSLHNQVTHDHSVPCLSATRTQMGIVSGERLDIAEEIASATEMEVTDGGRSHPSSHTHQHLPGNWNISPKYSTRPSSLPKQTHTLDSSHHTKGAFASSPVHQELPSLPALSSTPPFASLLREHDSPKPSRSLTSDSSSRSSGSLQRKSSSSFQKKDNSSESVDGKPPLSSPPTGLWGADDDFVMVELKPAFASKSGTSGDLGSFFRECQSAPPLNLFQGSKDMTLDNIMESLDSEISTYQDCLPIFDELVANLQQSQIS